MNVKIIWKVTPNFLKDGDNFHVHVSIPSDVSVVVDVVVKVVELTC